MWKHKAFSNDIFQTIHFKVSRIAQKIACTILCGARYLESCLMTLSASQIDNGGYISPTLQVTNSTNSCGDILNGANLVACSRPIPSFSMINCIILDLLLVSIS